MYRWIFVPFIFGIIHCEVTDDTPIVTIGTGSVVLDPSYMEETSKPAKMTKEKSITMGLDNLQIEETSKPVKIAQEKPVIINTGKMIGLDTLHRETTTKSKINKDTIITHNLQLEKRGKKPSSSLTPDDREPDWTYSSIPEEVKSYVEQFKKNMTECLKEVQENDKRNIKRLSPKMESPVHGECLIACVFKRNGVIENNKVNKDNLIQLVSKFFAKDTRLMKKLEKNLDQCIEMSAHHHNDCDLAAKLNECTNELMTSNKHKILVNY